MKRMHFCGKHPSLDGACQGPSAVATSSQAQRLLDICRRLLPSARLDHLSAFLFPRWAAPVRTRRPPPWTLSSSLQERNTIHPLYGCRRWTGSIALPKRQWASATALTKLNPTGWSIKKDVLAESQNHKKNKQPSHAEAIQSSSCNTTISTISRSAVVIQYGHLVGHVTRHLPPLYYWLSATLSFLSRISNSITLLPNGQKTALFCVPQQCYLTEPRKACFKPGQPGQSRRRRLYLIGANRAVSSRVNQSTSGASSGQLLGSDGTQLWKPLEIESLLVYQGVRLKKDVADKWARQDPRDQPCTPAIY